MELNFKQMVTAILFVWYILQVIHAFACVYLKLDFGSFVILSLSPTGHILYNYEVPQLCQNHP